VAHTSHPSWSENRGWGEEIKILGLPRQKSSGDPISINKKLSTMVSTCHPSYMGSINRRIVVQAGEGIHVRPYLKNNQSRGLVAHSYNPSYSGGRDQED
jgi:hypothetical protein